MKQLQPYQVHRVVAVALSRSHRQAFCGEMLLASRVSIAESGVMDLDLKSYRY